MGYEVKFEYLCSCGHGTGLTDQGWIAAGSPWKAICGHCGAVNRYRRLDQEPESVPTPPSPRFSNVSSFHAVVGVSAAPERPIAEAVAGLVRRPAETALSLSFIILLCALLLSGWGGRLLGAAAVILNSLPPHSL